MLTFFVGVIAVILAFWTGLILLGFFMEWFRSLRWREINEKIVDSIPHLIWLLILILIIWAAIFGGTLNTFR